MAGALEAGGPVGEGDLLGRGSLLGGDGLLEGFDAADVAAADRARLSEGADLMAVASAALARTCATRLREVCGRVAGTRVVLLVGSGNNGGDALLAGARLRRRGTGVTALLCGGGHHEAGAVALAREGGELLRVPDPDPDGTGPDGEAHGGLPARARAALAAADLVVDGLLGIGSRGAVRGAGGLVLAALTAAPDSPWALPRPRSVVACDLPSGLDPDTGLTAAAVLPADVTVTFGAAKTGLLLPWSQHLLGRLVVVDLGLRPHLPARPAVRRLVPGQDPGATGELLGRVWPWPWREADKYSRGVLGVAAGEAAYPGAAVLAVRAATRTGAGMVRVVPPVGAPDVGRLVLESVPEGVVQPLEDVGRVQAWVVGPGTSGGPDPRATHVLVAADEPAVVDAGALTLLAEAAVAGTLRRPERLLLTPHAGELARLLQALGPAEADQQAPDEDRAGAGGRWQGARAAAARTGGTVLLKGADTLVVSPDGTTVVVPGGPPALATAGAGDVLAGVAGAALAAGLPPATAGVLAAHVHAVAAHRAGGLGPLHASAVVAAVAAVLTGAHPDSWDHG